MKTNHFMSMAAAAAAVLLAPGVYAQSSAPASRESVKAETRAAAAAGTLTPAGQASIVKEPGRKSRSTKTRAQRKADTNMERAMGGLTPAGQGSAKPDHMNTVPVQPKNRAAVQSETRAAERAGTLTPAGEATRPSTDAPKR